MPIYRQHSRRLRLQYGPGRPDVVSERPYDERRQVFLDGEAPTHVELSGDEIGFDVTAWLRAGGGVLADELPPVYRLTRATGETVIVTPEGEQPAPPLPAQPETARRGRFSPRRRR